MQNLNDVNNDKGEKVKLNNREDSIKSNIQAEISKSAAGISDRLEEKDAITRIKSNVNTLHHMSNQNVALSSLIGMGTTYLTLDTMLDIDDSSLTEAEKNILMAKIQQANTLIKNKFHDRSFDIINNSDKKQVSIPFMLAVATTYSIIADQNLDPKVSKKLVQEIGKSMSKETSNNMSVARNVSAVLGVIAMIGAVLTVLSLTSVIPGGIYLYVSLGISGLAMAGSLGIKFVGVAKMTSAQTNQEEIEYAKDLMEQAEKQNKIYCCSEPAKASAFVYKIMDENQKQQLKQNNQLNIQNKKEQKNLSPLFQKPIIPAVAEKNNDSIDKKEEENEYKENEKKENEENEENEKKENEKKEWNEEEEDNEVENEEKENKSDSEKCNKKKNETNISLQQNDENINKDDVQVPN